MERHGHLPLPPYIERQQNTDHDPDAAEDSQRYQTVFARAPGAVAAPTAALHFDDACWPTWQRAASSAPASPCTWARAPSSAGSRPGGRLTFFCLAKRK
jgi:hypothetical protein